MKVYLCHMCNSLYVEGRPFVCCKCRSNIMIKEYEATQEEIDKVEGVTIIKDFEKMAI